MSTQKQRRTFDATATRETWTAFMSRVQAVADECILEIDDDGIRTQANTSDKSMGVKARVEPAAFEGWNVADELEMGVDLSTFSSVVELADKSEPVRVAWDEEDHKFHVQGGEFEYTLAGIEPEYVQRFDRWCDGEKAKVLTEMEPDRLKEAIKAASVCFGTFGRGTSLWLAWDHDKEAVVASADGDTDSVSFQWPRDDLQRVEAPAEGAGSKYGPGLLDGILKALNGSETATFEWGEEYPLLIEQSFGDAGRVEYVLAPRLQTH